MDLSASVNVSQPFSQQAARDRMVKRDKVEEALIVRLGIVRIERSRTAAQSGEAEALSCVAGRTVGR